MSPKNGKMLTRPVFSLEFMEQRAPGHTTLDGIIYQKGMLDFKEEIKAKLDDLDFIHDPQALERAEELKAMDISCDAVILFARRHSRLAREMADAETDARRKEELEKIAYVCDRIPAHAPQTMWEAIQMYWFVHLGTITELKRLGCHESGTSGPASLSLL